MTDTPTTESVSHPLYAIGAADGRYVTKTRPLQAIVSEFGLIRYRVRVECEWLLFLSEREEIAECRSFTKPETEAICSIVQSFDLHAAERVKELESVTNHDVKAVEYYVKERLRELPSLTDRLEWVHFACTSEDINNTAYALMLRDAREVVLEQTRQLIERLGAFSANYADLAMLSRTHGQAASPTTLGKEFANVAARLERQHRQLAAVELLGKFNGAVGNYNAHIAAYPRANWPQLANVFLERLGLKLNPWTTQIEPHDYVAELFDCLKRLNQIVLDFDRDVWSYISIEYFKQRKVEGETGSSTMPHKVNPIDFENSEGNLGVANALLSHMAEKLVVSRWQRDLSDSTVLRNIGTAVAHCVIAYAATLKGLDRLEVNAAAIAADLDASWEVLAEPVQTVMRKYGMEEPYEQLKAATRGRRLDRALYAEILDTLDLPEAAVAELKDLTPASYIGLAPHLARQGME